LADIKSPPKSIRLVDIALLLSIIPHLGHLRFPMLVYLLIAFAVLVTGRNVSKPLRYFLALFGLFSVISSFYNDFNFASFSRFALFISFLNATLIYAVILQRLEEKPNFYLAFSPALLLMLSFFLHNSVGMLFYSLFTLFVFLFLLLWYRMGSSLLEAMRVSLSIFAYALPVVALLFMVFPRISFEKADYGFRDELVKRSGYNGKMSLGSDALLVPSAKIVMEVYFEKALDKGRELYFRGTTLYVDGNDSFRPLPACHQQPLKVSRKATGVGESIDYGVTLYPHHDKWLYSLDIAAAAPPKSILLDDYTIVSKTKVDKILRYRMRSYLQYRMDAPLSSEIREAALQADETRDAVSAKIAKTLVGSNDRETLANLARYFDSLGLTYTLRPGKLDRSRPVDSFLQESKRGYCVHFAAAFTYMARISGLPTRIVTGYLINSDDALENYLVVREKSAHAWPEVYLEGEGWTRVETTDFAKHFGADALQNLNSEGLSTAEKLFKRLNLHAMYLKYVVETWILEYSRVKQMEILHKLLNNSVYLFTFVFYLTLFIALSLFLAFFINSHRCRSGLSCLMQPLLRRAKKEGLEKGAHESMHDFLSRLRVRYDETVIDEIDRLYHTIKYAKKHDNSDIKRLKEALKAIKIKAVD